METEIEMANAMESGYQAALEGVAFLHRKDRRFLEVTGKAPGEMLKGILSGTIPGPLKAWDDPEEPDEGRGTGEGRAGHSGRAAGDTVLTGSAYYSTALTPKGRMVTDLRVIPRVPEGFLLELSDHGLPGLEAHFKKYLHPRFAQMRNRSRELGMVSVLGPRARIVVGGVLGVDREAGGTESDGAAPGAIPDAPAAASSAPRAPVPLADAVAFRTHPALGDILVLEDRDPGVPALDLIAELPVLESLQTALQETGALPLSHEEWDILRIEAGTPVFGVDMTEDTIPVEAGIHHRAVDYLKGCYTGQEVIIRIRDRGTVNKSLRKVFLGGAPVPEPGAELFAAGGERSKGWVTSACRSPRYDEAVALAYVKRGLGPGDEVRLGGPHGATGRVEDLTAQK